MASIKQTRDEVFNYFNKRFRIGWEISTLENFYNNLDYESSVDEEIRIKKELGVNVTLPTQSTVQALSSNKFTINKFVEMIHKEKERVEARKRNKEESERLRDREQKSVVVVNVQGAGGGGGVVYSTFNEEEAEGFYSDTLTLEEARADDDGFGNNLTFTNSWEPTPDGSN